MDTTGTSWADIQFGDHAGEVARRVVQALVSAQEVGTRTQRASGQSRRYAYGSTWTSRYEQLVYQFTEAAGGELPPVQILRVAKAPYDLVRVNGRPLIPFVLARSLADIPDRPKLTSEILRAIAAKTVPPPAPEPSLLDFLDEPDLDDIPGTDASVQMPVPRRPPEAPCSTSEKPAAEAAGEIVEDEGDGPAPVFIGVVGNADTDSLLALRWGTAESIDEDGVMTWSPVQLPLELAGSSTGLHPVPTPRESAGAGAFNEGSAPEITVTARPYPVAPDTASPAPADDQQRDAVGDSGE